MEGYSRRKRGALMDVRHIMWTVERGSARARERRSNAATRCLQKEGAQDTAGGMPSSGDGRLPLRWTRATLRRLHVVQGAGGQRGRERKATWT